MPEMNQTKKKVEEVKKPTMIGSFCGADALKLAFRRFLNMFVILLVFIISAFIFSFDALWLKIIFSAMIIFAVVAFTYSQGAGKGESDAGFGEIMYVRQQEGKTVSKEDHDRCFHSLKGYFAAFLGALPFLLIAIYFACTTTLSQYTIGVLPSWTESLLEENDFGDALAYYAANQTGIQAYDILRIVIRGFVMPFINVAVSVGNSATLLVERLSPVLLLIPSIGYGVGYSQGMRMRIRVNTSIKLGVEKKKRKERKERKKRQHMERKPEQLI